MKSAKWVTTFNAARYRACASLFNAARYRACASLILVGGALSAAVSLNAQALSHVPRLNITSRRPAFDGRSFGTAGPYEILLVRAQPLPDAKAAQNAGIVDIVEAP